MFCDDSGKNKLLYIAIIFLSIAIPSSIGYMVSVYFFRNNSSDASPGTVADIYKKGGEIYCLFDGDWTTFSGKGEVVSKSSGWMYDANLRIFYKRDTNRTVKAFAENLCFKPGGKK